MSSVISSVFKFSTTFILHWCTVCVLIVYNYVRIKNKRILCQGQMLLIELGQFLSSTMNATYVRDEW